MFSVSALPKVGCINSETIPNRDFGNLNIPTFLLFVDNRNLVSEDDPSLAICLDDVGVTFALLLDKSEVYLARSLSLSRTVFVKLW